MVALVAVLGLASCSSIPANDGETTGDTGGGSTGGGTGSGNTGGSTGGSTGGGATEDAFVVQLIASNSAVKAESIKNVFVGEGYKNAQVSVKDSIHRVQIGPYATQAEAQKVLDKMHTRYKKNPHVKNAVVKTVNGI